VSRCKSSKPVSRQHWVSQKDRISAWRRTLVVSDIEAQGHEQQDHERQRRKDAHHIGTERLACRL